jgi:hypothetical protein
LDYALAGSSTIQTFWAFVEKYEGQYYSADIDLTPLAGQDVKFILSVSSIGSPAGDRALWVAPIIYNASSVSLPSVTPIPSATSAPATVTATPTASQAPTATVVVSTNTPTATTAP